MSLETAAITTNDVRPLATDGEAWQPARFSVDDFERMIEAGVLARFGDRRVELIAGEIRVMMNPANPPHDYVVEELMVWANEYAREHRDTVRVRVQSSLGLPELASVPSPDVALLKQRGDYFTRRPSGEDVLLVIEVSDSTLRYDLETKASLYARAEIAEYWVVDIPHRELVVHRRPKHGSYGSIERHEQDQTVRVATVEGLELRVGSLFG